jgi:hypothetical protein
MHAIDVKTSSIVQFSFFHIEWFQTRNIALKTSGSKLAFWIADDVKKLIGWATICISNCR